MNKRLLGIIQLTKSNPTAYLGRTGSYYSGLAGFIVGFAQGAKDALGDSETRTFPTEFNDFVKYVLNQSPGGIKYGPSDHWIDIIITEAGTQEKAFDLFFELFESFKQSSPTEFPP